MSDGKENDRCSLQRAEWVREQTGVKDIRVEIKKKWKWAEHVVCKQDNCWSLNQIPREGKPMKVVQKVRQTDGIKKFAGITWQRKVQDRVD